MASSSTFDPSYGDALSCFVAGGTLHVGKTKAATFEHLGVLLGKSKAHFCALTPSLASTISDSDLQAIQNPLLITLGGERAGANLLEKLINSTNIKVANTYGVTECGVPDFGGLAMLRIRIKLVNHSTVFLLFSFEVI